MMRAFFMRRILLPILNLLRQGITPEKIALSIALGIVLGVTPVLGSTTILCMAAAVALKLNLPAMQLVNYLVYPLQLALLLPFIRMGEWIFAAPHVQLTALQIAAMIRSNVGAAIAALWTATLHALVAWMAIGALASPLIYMLLMPALKRLARPRLEVQ